ncbi:hypothetical protein [Natronincola ferrireducens]|uniref:Uncharacterized protein n=1 Tax=Natronincola ferrireducens TaxID=393762 RepID=A0A1G8ZC52_9FIRM|nr:hypothetical protein [Natronincola ferrireducens]SDK12607.1 hypothetical protein SAMN05660472_00808 [Natronincola ferrireducens]
MTIFRGDLLRILKKRDMKALKQLINEIGIIKLIHIFKHLQKKDATGI